MDSVGVTVVQGEGEDWAEGEKREGEGVLLGDFPEDFEGSWRVAVIE